MRPLSFVISEEDKQSVAANREAYGHEPVVVFQRDVFTIFGRQASNFPVREPSEVLGNVLGSWTVIVRSSRHIYLAFVASLTKLESSGRGEGATSSDSFRLWSLLAPKRTSVDDQRILPKWSGGLVAVTSASLWRRKGDLLP